MVDCFCFRFAISIEYDLVFTVSVGPDLCRFVVNIVENFVVCCYFLIDGVFSFETFNDFSLSLSNTVVYWYR